MKRSVQIAALLVAVLAAGSVSAQEKEQLRFTMNWLDPDSIVVVEPGSDELEHSDELLLSAELFVTQRELSREIAPYGRPAWLSERMTLGTADYRPLCALETRTGREVTLPNPSLLQLPDYELVGWGACGSRPRSYERTIILPPAGESRRTPDTRVCPP